MNPYGAKTNEANIIGPLTFLKILYSELPKTVGCEKCVSVNGKSRKDWCCKELNPSMFYVEFLYAWKEVQNKWNKVRRRELIFRAIENYLRNSLQKGCIFYQDGCLIHSHRPLSCHMYAVTPKEVWKERIDLLKERHGEDFPVHDQCDLVTTEDGREYVSCEDDDKWFGHVRKCEARLGVAQDVLSQHDLPGGSYRTFHDHLLIELFPPEALEALTRYRLTNPAEDDIEHVVDEIIDRLDEPLLEK